MSNVLILNGSPRKNGNTSALVNAFAEGARAKGNQVDIFFLQGMDIHHCLGCKGGHSDQECPCVQKDDMAKIYPVLKNTDVVVLASPLYYWNVSGQLKTAIDRFYALEENDGQHLRGNRKGVLLMSAAGSAFEDSLSYFDHLMEHLKWENLGHVLSSGNKAAGDIEGKKDLQIAYDLGASIG